MTQRHVPERTCIACRATKPKRELVRIVRTGGGGVVVDPTGKQAGRGAYLCREPECWNKGLRKEALARALKTAVGAADRVALERFAASLTGAARGMDRAPAEGSVL